MAINNLESCFIIQKQINLWVSCGAWLTSIMVVLSLVSIIEGLEHCKDSFLFLQLFFHEVAVSCQQGGVPAYLKISTWGCCSLLKYCLLSFIPFDPFALLLLWSSISVSAFSPPIQFPLVSYTSKGQAQEATLARISSPTGFRGSVYTDVLQIT